MKVVRLTESDLTRIIQRIILETDNTDIKITNDLDGMDVLFDEETGLIPRRGRQFTIKSTQNVKLNWNGQDSIKLNLSSLGKTKELTYDCAGSFVDLNEKVIGKDNDKTTIEKKAFAGWKKYTKWKNPVLAEIITTRTYCGKNANNPKPIKDNNKDNNKDKNKIIGGL